MTPAEPSISSGTSLSGDSRLEQLRSRRQASTVRPPSVGSARSGASGQSFADRLNSRTREGSSQRRDSVLNRLVAKRQSDTAQRRDVALSRKPSASTPAGSREGSVSGRGPGGGQRPSPERDVSGDRVRLDARGGTAVPRTRPTGIDRIREATRGRIGDRRAKSSTLSRSGKIDRSERVRIAGSEPRHRDSLRPRLDDYARRSGGRIHRPYTPRHSQVVYRDRPDLIRHHPHHVHMYRDRYHRLTHRIIWPRYHYPVYYRWGPYYRSHWVYPYYHRKYVFVSLGGWWPWHYRYSRYYWYGYHPYIWYGYHPVPREVAVGSTNYYTYNYYTGEGDTVVADSGALPYGIDEATLANVQERLAQQQAGEPAAQTQADVLFESGVKSFEAGQFAGASQAFAQAMTLAPDDMILPFAYSQALFANNQYSESAEVLRAALEEVSPEEQGVFYPRGLYADDDALFSQIEALLDKVETYGFDADLQLLLGYHLLGVGEIDYARAPLEQAAGDLQNAKAAKVLLDLLDKMAEASAATAAGSGSTPSSGVTIGPSNAGAVASPAPQSPGMSDAAKADILERAKAASAPSSAGAGGGSTVTVPASPVNSQAGKKEDDESPTKQNISPVPGGQ